MDMEKKGGSILKVEVTRDGECKSAKATFTSRIFIMILQGMSFLL